MHIFAPRQSKKKCAKFDLKNRTEDSLCPERARGIARIEEFLRSHGRRGAIFRGERGRENAFFENFANFWRARSRLYQNEILQQNMRLTAFFKLYKICILLHRCNLKFFAKNRFEKLRINFRKISENFRKFWQILLIFLKKM